MGGRAEIALPTLAHATHTYTFEGRVLPGVTSVLAANGFYEFPFASPEDLAYKMRLGRDVHVAADLFDRGALDWATVSEEVGAYLSGWIQFRIDRPQMAIVASEQVVHYRALDYCGSLDRVLRMGRELVMADIKIGAELPAAALQTAAYKAAYNEARRPAQQVTRRLSIHLTATGRYRVVEHDDPQDFRAFCAALQLFHWRQKHA
jgi:hypothetical protein